MQGEALLIATKRPSQVEKGVPLILEYYYLYSCLALLCKLIVVITPLSIRRGDGGEASSFPTNRVGGGFYYIPQKNRTMICAVKIRKNILKGYTVE